MHHQSIMYVITKSLHASFAQFLTELIQFLQFLYVHSVRLYRNFKYRF